MKHLIHCNNTDGHKISESFLSLPRHIFFAENLLWFCHQFRVCVVLSFVKQHNSTHNPIDWL